MARDVLRRALRYLNAVLPLSLYRFQTWLSGPVEDWLERVRVGPLARQAIALESSDSGPEDGGVKGKGKGKGEGGASHHEG